MPRLPRLPAGAGRISGQRLQLLLVIAQRLATEGRRRWARLDRREQAELTRLLRASRGRPGALTQAERRELRRIVFRAFRS